MAKKRNPQDAVRAEVKRKLSLTVYLRDQKRLDKRLTLIEAGLRSVLADN